jgi:RNA polymerase sigma-70 factor, ECF subfamily
VIARPSLPHQASAMPAAAVHEAPQTAATDPGVNRARLGQMFMDHHQILWRTLRRFGMSPEAAADTAQQAFLVAAERLADIRPGRERAFLFGVAWRLSRASFRRNKRYSFESDMDLRMDNQAKPEQALERHLALRLMDEVLAKLDDDLLQVFVLFELEGMSTPEVAELVGIPVGTAASRLRRAREAFRSGAKRLLERGRALDLEEGSRDRS